MKNINTQINKGHKILSLSKGFTLVETLVAISIFTLALIGLMSVLASGVADTTYAKQKLQAMYLAQEGIECVRNIRDTSVLYNADSQTGWENFNSAPKTCPSIIGIPGFTRVIQATPINQDEVKISSVVSWKQGSGNYSITFSENLFNWVQ